MENGRRERERETRREKGRVRGEDEKVLSRRYKNLREKRKRKGESKEGTDFLPNFR